MNRPITGRGEEIWERVSQQDTTGYCEAGVMMNRYCLIFSLIAVGILTIGCLDFDEGGEDREDYQLVWDEYTENGTFDFIARESERTVSDS